MNQRTLDRIYNKALKSSNHEAVLKVAQALNDIGEIDKANVLLERLGVFHGIGFGADEYVFGVDYFAVQTKLNALGVAKPPLVVDGKWGPKSKAALMAFQKAKGGLVVDGIPGPMSLAALGLSGTSAKPTPNPNSADAKAYAIGKKAGAQTGMTEAEIQYVVAVAKGEGGYGNGWGNPSAKTIEESKSFGITGYEGVGSNNWGAVQGSGSAGSFPHVDHHADGTAYLGYYKKYATPEEGFLDMAHTILGGGPIRKAVGAAEIKAAIAKGNLHDAVYAQHANGYFELNPDKYLASVLGNYSAILNNTGWPKVLDQYGVTPAKAGIGGVVLGLGALAFFLFRKKLGFA